MLIILAFLFNNGKIVSFQMKLSFALYLVLPLAMDDFLDLDMAKI